MIQPRYSNPSPPRSVSTPPRETHRFPRLHGVIIGILITTFLGATLSQALAGDPVPEPVPESAPVNVILILADDVGVDQVGCYASGYQDTDPGLPTPCTPVIDSLAAKGIRFTNAWSNPVCSPTRTQILTGMPGCFSGMGTVTNPTRPHQVGLDPTFCTIPKQAAASAAAGKWHLADETQGAGHPLDVGFDAFLGPMYNLTGFPQDGPSFTSWRQWNGMSCEPDSMTQYATARTTDDAINFLQGFTAEPWYLYLPFNASHAPFECPPPDSCGTGCGAVDWCANCDAGSIVSMTRAMTQAMDANIGRLLDLVDFEDTAVIFIGDNGTPKHATVAPFDSTHAKGTLYQGGVNVPLIIRAPNQFTPYTCNALVSATDLFRTVTDFLQPTAPCSNPQSDSFSLLRYIDPTHEPLGPERTVVYSESFTPTFRPEPDGTLPPGYLAMRHRRAIRDSTHKLIEENTVLADGTQASSYEVYRLYDPLVASPLPHDPAILDDVASPDSLDSAFEKFDLLLASDPQEGLDAKARLLSALDQYRRLPIGRTITLPPCIVRSVEYGQFAPPPGGGSQPRTVSYFCDEDFIEVGYEGFISGFRIDRTFLEFNLSSGISIDPCRVNFPANAQIQRVMLDVAVTEGGSLASTTLEAWPVTGNIPSGMTEADCQTLFESIDTGAGPYTEVGEWRDGADFCSPLAKTFDLTSAIPEVEDAIAGNKLFTVALLRQTESGATDIIDFFDAAGESGNQYGLRIYYLPSQGGPGPGNGQVPRVATLGPSYPNPFSPETTIQYSVRDRAHVKLEVYDAAGRLVRSLVDEAQAAGNDYRVVWDGRDGRGNAVPSGVYYSRLQVGETRETGEMILIR